MKNPIPYKIAIGKSWSYDFPQEIYKLNYFKFSSANGGAGSSPPELKCIFEIKNSEQKFIEEIEKILNIYKDTNLNISKDNNGILKIEIFEWVLFDYDFQLVNKIEETIEKYNFELVTDIDFSKSEVILKNICEVYKDGYKYLEPTISFSYNPLGIELMCFMEKIKEEKFLEGINELLAEFNFDEVDYYRCQNSEEVNFRIYFKKHHTFLSEKGKYQFDVLDFDKRLFSIFNYLGIQNGRMKNDLNVIEIKHIMKNLKQSIN